MGEERAEKVDELRDVADHTHSTLLTWLLPGITVAVVVAIFAYRAAKRYQ